MVRGTAAVGLMLVLAAPVRAQVRAADAGTADGGQAFAELEHEVARRERELATRDFGFYGQDERRRLELELQHLQRIHRRLKSYALALPNGCAAFWRPGAQRTAQPTHVVTPNGTTRVAGPGASAAPQARAAITPQDFFCRPRGSVSDDIVAKVRAVEDAKRALQSNDFAYSETAARRALENRIGELEVELAQLGVPGDLYQPTTKIDVVTPEVQGGEIQPPAPDPATGDGFGGGPAR